MSLAGLSLRDLEYVVAVADCRHFGRAAERCNVSQPALSAQVRKVEAVLGLTIFERKRAGALLTKSGEAVVGRARLVLAEAQAMLTEAKSGKRILAGSFRMGTIPTIGPYVLPHALKPLREAFPAMRLILHEARTAELLAMLRAGELDAAVACAPIEEKAFMVHRLFFEPFLLMHQPARTPAWPPSPREQEVLLLEEGHCLRDQTLAACGPLALRAVRHATGLEMLRHMVAAGEGFSLMPALAAAALGSIRGFVSYHRLPADEGSGRNVVLASRSSDPRARQLRRMGAVLRKAVAPVLRRKLSRIAR
jgi:LysR family hydrogen peroxide-inducible transcriptional activator